MLFFQHKCRVICEICLLSHIGEYGEYGNSTYVAHGHASVVGVDDECNRWSCLVNKTWSSTYNNNTNNNKNNKTKCISKQSINLNFKTNNSNCRKKERKMDCLFYTRRIISFCGCRTDGCYLSDVSISSFFFSRFFFVFLICWFFSFLC